jgi:hypothetical protein
MTWAIVAVLRALTILSALAVLRSLMRRLALAVLLPVMPVVVPLRSGCSRGHQGYRSDGT